MTNKEQELTKALEEILNYKTNPIRRNQYAGNGGYMAPDWIQTKDKIFNIASKALGKL